MKKTHKRKKPGHYCKICGERKANEKFSGKGHAAHICKACMKLPVEKRNEMQTINRLENLPFYLSKGQRSWLEKKRKDHREEVREAAECAYEMRFPMYPSTTTTTETPFSDDWEFADELLLDDDFILIAEDNTEDTVYLEYIDDLPF